MAGQDDSSGKVPRPVAICRPLGLSAGPFRNHRADTALAWVIAPDCHPERS
jgi:hypothetical protein